MPDAARVGDPHVCPKVSPDHVGGVILPPGEPKVQIGGQSAARVSDEATCLVPPMDTIRAGSRTVLIGKRKAARKGDATAHGGKVAGGFSTVLIGDYGTGEVVQLPDGSIQVGDGIIIKGDPIFQAKTLAALKELGATETGQKMLGTLDNSGHKATIVPSTGSLAEDGRTDGRVQESGEPGAGCDSTIHWNPDKDYCDDGSEPWMKRPPSVGLGHELCHSAHDATGTTAYDYDHPHQNPPLNENQAVGLKDKKDGKPVDYSNEDYNENKLRKEIMGPGHDRPVYYQ